MAVSKVPLDIDVLIARIRAEAAKLDKSPESPVRRQQSAYPSIPRLAETPDPHKRHQLKDLLCFLRDEEFVGNAYRALLGHEPDEMGFRRYADYLRQGGSRMLVLHDIVGSHEGRARGLSVDGMRWVGIYQAMRGKRLLLPLLRRTERSYLRRFPDLVRRAEADRLPRQLDQANAVFEQRLGQHLEGIGTRLTAVEGMCAELRGGAEWLQRQIDEVTAHTASFREVAEGAKRGIDNEVARRQRLIKDIDFIRSDLIYHRTQVRRLLDKLARFTAEPGSSLPAEEAAREGEGDTLKTGDPLDARTADRAERSGAHKPGDVKKREPQPISDVLGAELKACSGDHIDTYYMAFEEEFRGSQEMIRATQEGYLADIRAADAGGSADPALDLGCGRGEWLTLLKECGFVARGVDANSVMVDQARERGLDVHHGDVLSLLSGLPDASLGAVTAFHLIEHLPFPALHDIIEQSHRALRPGGVLILETPNPENLLVGSHTFYHDPTHRNPMTPAATRFLVRYFGFEDPEIRRLHPYPEDAKVAGDDPLTERVNGHLCGPQDFAVIARRPIAPE